LNFKNFDYLSAVIENNDLLTSGFVIFYDRSPDL